MDIDLRTSVVVAMPWRPQPDRMEAYEYCRSWWEAEGLEVIASERDEGLTPNQKQPFSLAEARNHCVRLCADLWDVVIVADADTVPQVGPMEEAIRIASEPGNVVYPFDEYHYLSSNYIPGLLNKGFDIEKLVSRWVMKGSVGGIMVTGVQTYWDLGGMDERFERTWGFEDNAFCAVADTLAKVTRLPGKVYSFSHEVEGAGRDWGETNPNYWRNQLYAAAYGKPEMMKALIKR